MKLRHVRAVAVLGIAVVALTGARGSGGGGCDNSSSGSSGGSSSSSGGTTSGGSDDGSSSSTSGGYTTGGSTTGGSNNSAVRDIKIESCDYDPSRGIVARISARNSSSSEKYTYKFSVKFTDPSGTLLRTSDSTIPYVMPNTTDTLDVSAAYVPKGSDSGGGKCEVTNVTRTTA
ncbi:hypothetical protein [Streptomyces sp. SYSU K21746]